MASKGNMPGKGAGDDRRQRQNQNKRKAFDAISISSSDGSDFDPLFQTGSQTPALASLPMSPAGNGQQPGQGNPATGHAPSMTVSVDYLSQMAPLHDDVDDDAIGDVGTIPIFTEAVRQHAVNTHHKRGRPSHQAPFSQYGLLAGDASGVNPGKQDPRIFYNVDAPSSMFICGSQGSGKSHTLSCLLESCLLNSEANTLKKPLTGIVFHYDTFVSDAGGSPCEAAYISSNPNVDVRVLCSPTNVVQIKKLYSHLPNVQVSELRLNESDLNTKRMMELMSINPQGADGRRLYIQVIYKVLREMRIDEQHKGDGFNYSLFKKMMDVESLSRDQLGPLKQRLDVLESFMNKEHAKAYQMQSTQRTERQQPFTRDRQRKRNRRSPPVGPRQYNQQTAPPQQPVYSQRGSFYRPPPQGPRGERGAAQWPAARDARDARATEVQDVPRFSKESIWTPKRGRLTIVDLSCPMVPADMACSLFNMCLSLFLEQSSSIGRVIALDEAHKYMHKGDDPDALTKSLETAIRIQRHIGTRVIISTQEPTISPRLLDLCSATIVHRFSSPDWLTMLKNHLAGASAWLNTSNLASDADADTAMEGVIIKTEAGLGPSIDEMFVGIPPLDTAGPDRLADLFRKIVCLRTGEALLFAPSAAIGVNNVANGSEGDDSDGSSDDGRREVVRLGHGVLKVRVRKRVTQDGGQSIMATGN